jgi:uncharacterized iron-regulated protein
LATGKSADLGAVVKAAQGCSYVLVGEEHGTFVHQQVEADVIEALVKSGRDVVIGMEMFDFQHTPALNCWTRGYWDEPTFIERSEWKTQWGFDYAAYRPVFELAKLYRIPMVGLNVPRDWVRTVSRGGVEAMTDEMKTRVPRMDLTNKNHAAIFDAMMGGHPMGDTSKIYSGMVMWDEAMAANAMREIEPRRNPNAVMVICVGMGHVIHKQGISWRIDQSKGGKSLTVICLGKDVADPVAKSLGDFAFRGKASDYPPTADQ